MTPSTDDRAFVRAFPRVLAAFIAVAVLACFQPEAARDIPAWMGWVAGAIAVVMLPLCVGRNLRRKTWTLAVACAGLSIGILLFCSAGRLGHLLWLVFALLTGRALAYFWGAADDGEEGRWREVLRWLLLVGLSGAIMSPYATPLFVGGGDAQVYAQTLADFLAQVRASVFPVLVGQSEFAPNGEIHPLRTAPGFHYLGGALNLLTWGSLPPVGVMNLVIVLHGIAAAFSAYFSLRAFAPAYRWTCLLFTVLFVTSPGILAPLFGGDLIASWITLPWLPPLMLGALQLGDTPAAPRALSRITICLAALWLLHAPIAFWSSVLLAPFGIAFALRQRPGRALLGAAGLFLILGGYVFVSVVVLAIPVDPELRLAVQSGAIENNLRVVWSGFLRPVSPDATALLSDQQLSPGLWLALALSMLALGRVHSLAWRLLLATSIGLVLILQPKIGGTLFRYMPDLVLNATEKWPSQRLLLLLSCCVPFLGLAALTRWWPDRPKLARDFTILLALTAAWSTWECAKFVRRGLAITHTADISRRTFRPENLSLPRYSFEYFGPLPRYFSHGPVAPAVQVRLLARDTLEVAATNPSLLGRSFPRLAQILSLRATHYGGQFEPALVIPAHSEGLLHFAADLPRASGVLQITSKDLRQEFLLPHSGEERAFGLGRPNSPHLVLSNPEAAPETVDVKYIRTGGDPATNGAIVVHAHFFQRTELPLRIDSLVPLRVAVNSEQPAWLETPRLSLAGYRAQVDGAQTRTATSPDGYVMIPVPAGDSVVELNYPGPWPVRLSFWITALGWIGVGAAACSQTLRARWERRAPAIAAILIAATGAFAAVTWARERQIESLPFRLNEVGEHVTSCELRLPIARPPGQTDLLAEIDGDARDGVLLFVTVDGKTGQVGFRPRDARPVFGPAFKVNYRAIQHLEITWPAGGSVPVVRWNEQIVLGNNLVRAK